MKKSVSISVESEKLSALMMYLEQRNLTLANELTKYVDSLYLKNVPKNIRDFIGMKESAKAGRKPKKALQDTLENESEQ